ncbi:Hsp20/alpha crystallin family protein [Desulfobacterales bacterium HSG16]|nr:Hsp20/alpha crystallin family protein [Desulfobacterales bacterium HSG16]
MILRRVLNPYRTYSPFAEMERIHRQMGRLFEHASGDYSSKTPAGVFPLVNLTENNDKYYVRAELPGLTTDDIDINVTGKNLSIAGKRKIPSEGEDVKYHRRERDAGRFSRALTLPDNVDGKKVTAKLSEGVLMITLPKAENAKPQHITIH